jgi:hyaluronate lyase
MREDGVDIAESGGQSDAFDRLRAKWKEMLTGGSRFDDADPDLGGIVTRITAEAEAVWGALNRSDCRTSLWDDLADPDNSAAITSNYGRIWHMALACETYGSRLYQHPELVQDIVSALDWLHVHRYNSDKAMRGNWWDWGIGAPLKLLECMLLMYVHLSGEQRSAYIRSVDHFKPEVTPSSTGANRVWDCVIIGLRGVIGQNGDKITAARDSLFTVFSYATNGDGFYRDGSFIQHDVFAYTGGYGQSLIRDMANLMVVLHDSPWQVTAPEGNHVFSWIHDAYEPLIYKGAMMDMAMGRVISRRSEQNHDAGHIIANAVILLSTIAPHDDALAFKRIVKEWIRSDMWLSFYADATLYTAIIAKAIMNDERIIPRGELRVTKQFANMARTVHFCPSFAFAISMHSNRIANYETINRENLRGWHTGDGMTYLYNSDLSQYCDAFWPTVNSYRLPGTTVIRNTEVIGNVLGEEPWAGGTELLCTYGAAGMSLHPHGQTLRGQKSWFLFDEEIVALGSGIVSSDRQMVETVVENRKINSSGNNALTVDGVEKPDAFGWNESMEGVEWIHLQGNVPGSDIGYYFPGSATVQGLRESRTDAWSSINRLDNDGTHLTRSFLNLWLEHGDHPADASYAYVLLPNKTASEVSEYVANPHVIVLENSRDAHAVMHTKLNMTAINVWNDGDKKINGIRVSGKSSLMVKENERSLNVAVSDPTFGAGTIRIEIDREAEDILSCDPGVTIVRLRPTIQLEVDVLDANGRTFQATFEITP